MKNAARVVAVLTFVTTLPLLSASRAEDFVTGPHWIGGQFLPAEILSLAADDHTLYASCADGRLHVLDLADPDHPRLAGAVALPEARQKIVLQHAGFLYLAGDSTLSSIDARDPLRPRWAGAYPQPIRVGAMAMDDGFAAVCASGPRRLVFFDASDPANLVAIDQLDVAAEYVAIAGDVVVYAVREISGGPDDGSSWSSLYSVLRQDLRHPRACFPDEPHPSSGTAIQGMDLSGLLVCKWCDNQYSDKVTPWRNWLGVYDVRPDGTLVRGELLRLDRGGSHVTGGFTASNDGRIIVPFADGKISVLGVGGATPVIEGWTSTGPSFSQAVHAGGHIYGCSGDTLQVLKLGEMTHTLWQRVEGTFRDASLDGRRRACTTYFNDMSLCATYVSVDEIGAAGESRRVVHVNVPDVSDDVSEVDLRGDLVVASGEPTYTLDLSADTPGQLHEQERSFKDFTTLSPTVGAAASTDGLLILSLTDPTALSLIGTLPGDPLARIEYLGGESSVVIGVTASHEARLFDLSRVETPVEVARFGVNVVRAVPVDGAIQPTLAVTRRPVSGCVFARLDLYDVTAPAAPRLVGALDVPGFVEAAVQVGDDLYLACGRGGIVAVDVADPTRPTVRGGLTAANVHSLALDGTDLLVADQDDVARVHLENTFTLAEIGGDHAGGQVDLAWRTVIAPAAVEFRVHRTAPAAPDVLPAARTADGWQAVDTLPAWFPARTATYELQARLAPTQAWFAAATITVSLDLPAASRVIAATPNPFNPQTSLRYELGAATTYAIRIHDARGRCVRHLAAGDATPGMAEVIWDGRDDRGRALPTGTYLARLTTDASTSSLKLTLVR